MPKVLSKSPPALSRPTSSLARPRPHRGAGDQQEPRRSARGLPDVPERHAELGLPRSLSPHRPSFAARPRWAGLARRRRGGGGGGGSGTAGRRVLPGPVLRAASPPPVPLTRAPPPTNRVAEAPRLLRSDRGRESAGRRPRTGEGPGTPGPVGDASPPQNKVREEFPVVWGTPSPERSEGGGSEATDGPRAGLARPGGGRESPTEQGPREVPRRLGNSDPDRRRAEGAKRPTDEGRVLPARWGTPVPHRTRSARSPPSFGDSEPRAKRGRRERSDRRTEGGSVATDGPRIRPPCAFSPSFLPD